jgi:hypothetical protein
MDKQFQEMAKVTSENNPHHKVDIPQHHVSTHTG